MNYILTLIIIFYILVNLIDLLLDFINYKYLKIHGQNVPPEFEGQIDSELLKKTSNYTLEKMRFGFVSSLFDEVIMLVFIFGGILDWYNSWIVSLQMNFICSGILFFILLSYVKIILGIPFSLYSSFKIENKYGFNTMTIKLWITDLIKSLIVSTLLLLIVLSVSLLIVERLPDYWWLPIWLFFLFFSLFIMYISPYILEPLFNKFTPLDDEELESDIKNLLLKTGIQISRVFKMDASKRTKHSNAYFSGIGKVKRIVLFDTLLATMEKSEILSVLAHEAGHWRKKHIIKLLFLFEIISLIGSYIAFLILKNDTLTTIFHLQQDTFFAKLILLSFVASILTYPLPWLFNTLSRHFEREADDFARELIGSGKPLASALVKLCKENLANLHPHPVYAKFHYSHPPATDRIRYLKTDLD